MLVLFQKTLSRLAHSKSVQCPKFILLEERKYCFEDFLKGILLSCFIRMLVVPLIMAFCLVTFRLRPKSYSAHTVR